MVYFYVSDESGDFLKDIEFICKTGSESFKIPFVFLKNSAEIIYDYSYGLPKNPVYTIENEVLAELNKLEFIPLSPKVFSTSYGENYIVASINDHYLIAGPSQFSFNVSSEELRLYFSELRIMDKIQLSYVTSLILFMLTGQMVHNESFIDEIPVLEIDKQTYQNVDIALIDQRHHGLFHLDHRFEKELLELVRHGKKFDVITYYDSIPKKGFGTLSQSQIRNCKNLFICMTTLLTRAAVEGGLHPEIAYTMSDVYIRHMEELTELKEVLTFQKQVVFDFADRVSKSNTQKYSTPVNICKKYIYSHIFDYITSEELGKMLSYNPVYLSQLFKKETGMSLHEYILHAKIEEAKKMLTSFELPLSEICSRLQFSDQSHFTKVFKKFTGVTPKKFKNDSSSKTEHA